MLGTVNSNNVPAGSSSTDESNSAIPSVHSNEQQSNSDQPTFDSYDFQLVFQRLADIYVRAGGWTAKIYNKSQKALKEFVGKHKINSDKSLEEGLIAELEELLFGKRIFIAFIGNFDSGKSYIINETFGKNFPSGPTHDTKGFSCYFDNNLIAIDTEGQDKALTKDMVKLEKEILRNSEEYALLREDITSFDKEKLSKHGSLKKQLKSRAITNAQNNKQSVENFLRYITFDLADIIVGVANSLNAKDQRLALKISADIHKHNLVNSFRQKHTNLYMIHNFKNTTDINELNDLVKRYIKGCFGGKSKEIEMLDRNGNLIKIHPIASAGHESVGVTHFFLGRREANFENKKDEDKELDASNYNEHYIANFKRELTSAYKHSNSRKPLRNLILSIEKYLKEVFKKVGKVKLMIVKDESNDEYMLKFFHEDELVPKSMDSIIDDHFYLILNDPTCKFDYDVTTPGDAPVHLNLKHNKARNTKHLNFMIDCPGLEFVVPSNLTKEYDVPVEEYVNSMKLRNNQFSMIIDNVNFMPIFFGRRSLYEFPFKHGNIVGKEELEDSLSKLESDDSTDEDESDEIIDENNEEQKEEILEDPYDNMVYAQSTETETIITYDDLNIGQYIHRGRKYGKFITYEKPIPVLRDYNLKKPKVTSFKGQVQITLKHSGYHDPEPKSSKKKSK
ncbi:hypothetical protein ABK040_014203 [Willaertia magna]